MGTKEYKKYEVTKASGEVVEDCIVLEFKDQGSRDALLAYAESITESNYPLHEHIINKIREYQIKEGE